MKLVGEVAGVSQGIRGWAYNEDTPDKTLKIVLTINGRKTEVCRTGGYIAQLHRDGRHPTGKCGFKFKYNKVNLNSGDVVDIYESRSQSRMAGAPFTFIAKQILFVHIPKTAGSAVNTFVSNKIGKQNTAMYLDRGRMNPETVSRMLTKRYVSGHLPIHLLQRHLDLSELFLVTLLRDPFDRLISNIAWTRRLAEEEFAAKFQALAPRMQELALHLKKMDMSDINQMSDFVNTLPPIGMHAFDNLQTRYLATGPVPDQVSRTQLNEAIEMLSRFDIVGTNEQYDKFLARLCEHADLSYHSGENRRVNVHKERFGLETQNGELKQILRPLYQFDEELYQAATKVAT